MLGVDVSKDTLDAALIDAATRALRWDWRLGNEPQGVHALLERVPADVAWVVEPTGRYSLLVVEMARQAGRTVLMAPPRQAKQYMESLQSRAKTDTLSARGLALMGLDRALRPYPLKSPHVDEIDQLLTARRGLAQAISSLVARGRDCPRVQESLAASVAALQKERAGLDKQLKQAVSSSSLSESVQRLDGVPGVGALTATAFAARLESKQFARPDAWVAYCGLDVAVRESGKRKGEKGLTKQGDAELRRLAYVCAQAAVRVKESPFARQFVRERAKGLRKTAAYCAVARKLLGVCWALHHHQQAYDARLVGLSAAERRQTEAGEAPTPL